MNGSKVRQSETVSNETTCN